MDVGCLVQNVGTAAAAHDAVAAGLPLIARIVTVTGGAVRTPKNLAVRVGTPLADVLAHCGGLTEQVAKVIFGGPMMGVGQFSLEVPVIKGTSGVLCLPRDGLAQFLADPCIRCGGCVDACPMGLVPSAMGLLAERGRFADLAGYRVNDCIECGSCAWICPSYRPLVQLIRRGKAELRAAAAKAAV
jgi:electron transport complex protein RnfC